MSINVNAFRHYDIRGKVPHDLPLTEIYTLARAIAAYTLEKNPQATTVIIGRDGRTHSPEIHRHVVQALLDCNFTIHDTGICPTPVVYFAAHNHNYDLAIMITASHNGPEYNGLKICLGKESVWGGEIQKIKNLYEQAAYKTCENNGLYQRVYIQQEYSDYLAEHFSDLRGCDKPVILDCGNGAVGAILRDVVDAVGLQNVTILCEEVDGTYPNHQANPVELENMHHVVEKVIQDSAYMAVGFDGDGDRMAAVTHTGELLSGDILLALFAQDVLSARPGATIVYDGKCSLIVDAAITEHGGIASRSPSGHSIIKNAMRTSGALFGGELSCHFFFADIYFGFDDGVYAFLRLVRLVLKSGKSLAELVQQFPKTHSTPEIRIHCEDSHKEATIARLKDYFVAEKKFTLSFDDGIRFENQIPGAPVGWGLVRASNTQPALCIRCESLTAQGLRELKQTIYDALLVTQAVIETYSMKELV